MKSCGVKEYLFEVANVLRRILSFEFPSFWPMLSHVKDTSASEICPKLHAEYPPSQEELFVAPAKIESQVMSRSASEKA
jgi:hypothetical protein